VRKTKVTGKPTARQRRNMDSSSAELLKGRVINTNDVAPADVSPAPSAELCGAPTRTGRPCALPKPADADRCFIHRDGNRN